MNQCIQALTEFNSYSVAFRLILSAIIGGCIGSERGRHGRAAGLRTHVLVCLGATLTTLVGLYAVLELHLEGDAMRISAQVISGIGFLGAGTIIFTRDRTQVTGLTTAAGLWTTASLGLALGLGFYEAVLVGFGILMVTISILTRLEHTVKRKCGESYYVELSDIEMVNIFFDSFCGSSCDWKIVQPYSGMTSHIGILCRIPGFNKENLQELLKKPYICIVIPMPKE